MKARLSWYVIKKYFRGGSSEYAFRLTKKIANEWSSWDGLFEYIGENTNGGHESGYTIHAYRKFSKPKDMKVLSIESVTRTGIVVK
jgi:hypothetical protein